MAKPSTSNFFLSLKLKLDLKGNRFADINGRNKRLDMCISIKGVKDEGDSSVYLRKKNFTKISVYFWWPTTIIMNGNT